MKDPLKAVMKIGILPSEVYQGFDRIGFIMRIKCSGEISLVFASIYGLVAVLLLFTS